MNQKVGRNDLCPCGSGLKYKKCCALKTGMQKYKAEVLTSESKVSSLLGRIRSMPNPNELKEKELSENSEN
ncbi:MAG: SEC-C metal-binding domain-containing protein [Chlamydiia bacterium]